MTTYYNEHDPVAAATLRELIKAGAIAPGDVDERSILDIRPADLRGYTQCHFFAGEGIWSLALRNAGWPDDRPVWTGSCPCQPFSAAGKGAGFDDERHLWPAWFWLVRHGKPGGVPVFGEQVASRDGLAWLDLVSADMEEAGYTFWAVDLCSAGFGAPHIRQRLYFVAHPSRGASGAGLCDSRSASLGWHQHANSGGISGMADHQRARLEGYAGHGLAGGEPGRLDSESSRSASPQGPARALDVSEGHRSSKRKGGKEGGAQPAALRGGKQQGRRRPDHADAGDPGRMADADKGGLGINRDASSHESTNGIAHAEQYGENMRPCPSNGQWRNADWLCCRDGKWRPVESGTFPLVAGLPASLGKLDPRLQRLAQMAGLSAASLRRARSYRPAALKLHGNAITEPVARGFIQAAREAIGSI